MMTGYATIETAIETLKAGAFDYITKPFKVDELLITVQRALTYQRTLTENIDLKEQLTEQYKFENIIAESNAMRHVCEMIKRVAPTNTTVLIYGESGTGKEIVARSIHSHSERKNNSFQPLNCAALPEQLLESELFGHVKGAFTDASSDKKGLLEEAEKGTVLLDDIESMPLNIQPKLLRVLEDKEIRKVGGNKKIPVDVRILASTNVNLEDLIAQKKFREDLYYRLSVIPIEIKPLRERKEDILPLVYLYLKEETENAGKTLPKISAQVREILENYSWPGNVRELKNAMKHATTFIQNDVLDKECLPGKILQAMEGQNFTSTTEQMKGKSLRSFLRAKEKEYLSNVLKTVNGDKQKAAEELKISLATLYRKLPEPKE
jgi:two-component system, NtrC family, response regulator PilR